MARIDITHGSEGPTHDPYSYSEITFTKTDGAVVLLHEGLAVWCEITPPGGRHRARMGSLLRRSPGPETVRIEDEDEAEAAFERETGIRLADAERLYRRATEPKRCRDCGSKRWEWHSGYPGETMRTCADCGHVSHTEMNYSAIE